MEALPLRGKCARNPIAVLRAMHMVPRYFVNSLSGGRSVFSPYFATYIASNFV